MTNDQRRAAIDADKAANAARQAEIEKLPARVSDVEAKLDLLIQKLIDQGILKW